MLVKVCMYPRYLVYLTNNKVYMDVCVRAWSNYCCGTRRLLPLDRACGFNGNFGGPRQLIEMTANARFLQAFPTPNQLLGWAL